MIKKIIVLILKLSPSSKKWFWKKWYNIFAKRARNPELKLMNYGYDSQNMDLRLEKEDEVERFSIQLYHYVTSHADMKNKDILEVGSGRGGGAAYIAKYLDPKDMSLVFSESMSSESKVTVLSVEMFSLSRNINNPSII